MTARAGLRYLMPSSPGSSEKQQRREEFTSLLRWPRLFPVISGEIPVSESHPFKPTVANLADGVLLWN